MTVEQAASKMPDPARPARPRGRRMAFFTLLMAGAYLWVSDFALNGGQRWGMEWEGVRAINSTRVFLGAMMPGRAGESDPSSIPLGGMPFMRRGPRTMTAEQRAAQLRLQREVAAVEAVAYLWQRIMWALAGMLVLAAVLSWITPWGRLWHLLSALAILLVSGLTLIAVRYVDIPDGSSLAIPPLSVDRYHGLLNRLSERFKADGQAAPPIPTGGGLGAPPLPTRTYVYLGAALSSYAWLLLLIYARRRRPSPAAVLPAGSA